MSKASIYIVNATPTTVAPGNVIPLGNTVRRFGCNIAQDGNTITLKGKGYFVVNANVTATPTAAGNVGITMLKNGVAVIGANGVNSVSAVGNSANVSITAIIRNMCDCDSSIISFVLDTTESSVDNVAISICKI